MIRIAINGFGRIGRNFLRTILEDQKAKNVLQVVAINIGPSSPDFLAHMFTYDTMLGKFPGSVQYKNNMLLIDDVVIPIITETDPKKIDWRKFKVDWVVEASGKFTKRAGFAQHIDAGARHVLITAPTKDEDITIIPGVNDALFNAERHTFVSLGSCTTNAIVPMLKVLHEAFDVIHGFMTTVHAYTNSQVLLDVERSDPRRARAAALNVIPTTTGAMSVLDKVYPALSGCIGGSALRVPVAKVSLIDLTVVVHHAVNKEAINKSFEQAAKVMPTILGVSYEPLVSSDYSKNPHSVVIDALLTDVRGSVVKVFGWYDNEWGYSERLKDFLVQIGQ